MTNIPTARTALPGNPFGIVTEGSYVFVSLNDSIAVLSNRTDPPKMLHQVSVGHTIAGIALTHSGHLLLVASGGGALVLSVTDLIRGNANPVVASLTSSGGGAIEVATSLDDRYAFVTLETSQEMAVFNLETALRAGPTPVEPIGMVPLGQAPVGIALSPDGRIMYVTSEGPRGPSPGLEGILSVIDVKRAESSPARSVLSSVAAGCSPVRVVTSADGATVWVTARGSNAVLGFSAAALISDPHHAEEANVAVGFAPVGLTTFDHDRRLVVTDSNRFNPRQPPSDLAVVDVQAALEHRHALIGYLPVGRFPRDVEFNPALDDLLVANYTSDDVQTVPIARLP